MKLVIFLCVLLAMSAESTSNNRNHVEGRCKLGDIRGSIMKSHLGRDIYSFRGIKYAEPPIEDLRFKPPVPVGPWSTTFDATEEGPACPQPKDPKYPLPMSEDCLRLNIYTTELPKPGSSGTPRPVVVFFHPGGFYIYSGQSGLFGPQYWLDEDIVLVTVNYRLGSLGSMSTGDAQAPGNNAFKDQVIALRFVQNHISAFGGDPNCVTIAGDSAGAWSVSLHLVSPMSEGLFHRAIAMSGSALYQNYLPPHQKHLAEKQARILGCNSTSSTEIIECLKTKSADELGGSLPQFREWYGDPALIWTPVVEPEVPGVERFLHAQPYDLIRQGKFRKVPLITGVTKDEFGFVVTGVILAAKSGDTAFFNEWNTNWTQIAPISYYYERGTPRSLEISEALRQFYFNGEPISLNNMDGMADLYSDALIIFQNHRLANLISQYSNQPVYYYDFTFQGRYSWSPWPDGKPYGVAHQDDLQYLFHIGVLFPLFENDAPEIPMVKKLTSMWTHFARTGEPIPRNNKDFANVTWTPFTSKNQAYLEIDTNLVMKKNLHIERMKKWEELFPLKPIPKS